ncbi:MAG: SH3 domain-containing protein [Erythrobacteraceae bacterium]|jgi:hypothetical protein|nr:SH3 domain-containing protein [Erythrobacteraceae bacterium]
MFRRAKAATAVAVLMMAANPAHAAKDDNEPELVRCEQTIGSIALVDGEQAGWAEWGLGSPRALINTLAAESGCFTVDNPNDQVPARFLVTALAGTAEEVDQSLELAKGAATEALLRSGAAGSLLGGVPGGGALLGVFGGLGGKNKTVAAGLRVISPANGLTVAAGQCAVKKSSIDFGNAFYGWAGAAADASGYQGSKNGKMLTEAFVLAFNQIVGQRELMLGAPEAAGKAMRNLRAGTQLSSTGKRDGLFIEVQDNFGTTGWVSVEDLQ